MSKAYICRYCDENFIPQPGKPGYIDECPECLHERTRPKIPEDFESRFLHRFPERGRALAAARRVFRELGLSEAMMFELMIEELRKQGTPV